MLGVVYNPILNDMYSAIKAGPATLNGRPIRVSSTEGLDAAMVVNNVGYSRDSDFIRATLGRQSLLLANGLRAVRNSGE